MRQGDKAWVRTELSALGYLVQEHRGDQIDKAIPDSPCLPEIAKVLAEMSDGERELLALKIKELKYTSRIFLRFSAALDSGGPRKTND